MTDTTELHKILTRSGFKWGEVIHLFLGARLGVSGDTDIYGVFIEPPERALGINTYFTNEQGQEQLEIHDHFIWSTGGQEKRNVDGDTDINLYSLRKWAGMAASGNSTALEFLFNPNVESGQWGYIWDECVLPHRAEFVTAHAGLHFNKSAQNQLDRLMGRKGQGRHGVRLDLVEKYGYDCYDDNQTEFLTNRGWLKFDEILDSDKVGTFAIETGGIEFQTPTKRIDKLHSGAMYTVEPSLTRCVVTPTHKMVVSPAHRTKTNGFSTKFNPQKGDWSLTPLAELMAGVEHQGVTRSMYHVRRSAAQREISYDVESEYLSLAGMFLSEGTISFRNGSVKDARTVQTAKGKREFHQLANRLAQIFNLHRYEYLLSLSKVESVWRIPRLLAKRLYNDFGHSKEKHLPNWCFHLSYDQTWLLWEGLCLGDGTRTFKLDGEGKGTVYYTSIKQLADDIQAAMVSAGHLCVVNGPYMYEGEIDEFGNTPMYQVYRPDDQNPYRCVNFKSGGLKAGEEPKEGYGYPVKETLVTDLRIVCFDVPFGTLVTRSNGKPAFHGNTKFAMHTIRILHEGIELMETGNITLPRPEAQMLVGIREGKFGTMLELEQYALHLFNELESARLNSPLPPELDRAAISRIVADAYLKAWMLHSKE